jgi:hypothetical protein
MADAYDLIVLGSGPGGARLTHAFKRLAENSLRMLA